MPTQTVPETLSTFRVRYTKASKAGSCSGCGKLSSVHKTPVNKHPRQTDAVIYHLEGAGGKYRLCRVCLDTLRSTVRKLGAH